MNGRHSWAALGSNWRPFFLLTRQKELLAVFKELFGVQKPVSVEHPPSARFTFYGRKMNVHGFWESRIDGISLEKKGTWG